MPETTNYKTGDTAPSFEVKLDSLHRNLEDATATFRLETPDGENLAVNDEMIIFNPSESGLRYRWKSGDLHEAGRYRGDIIVEWDDGEVRHVPTGSNYYYIRVGEPIDTELDPVEWEDKDISVSVATADEVHTELLTVGGSSEVTGIDDGIITDGQLVGRDDGVTESDLDNHLETDVHDQPQPPETHGHDVDEVNGAATQDGLSDHEAASNPHGTTLDGVVSQDNTITTRLESVLEGNDLWTLRDGSDGSNDYPFTMRFDDRDWRLFAGGDGGAGDVLVLGHDEGLVTVSNSLEVADEIQLGDCSIYEEGGEIVAENESGETTQLT